MTIGHGTRPVALITGASRGIGAATARELARRGYRLVLAARSSQALQQLAGELTQAGCPALPVPTDLCRADEVQRLARLALAHFGRVDALVNNAGIGSKMTSLVRMHDEAVEGMLQLNLVAPIALTRALLPGMIERRRGAIVFVASVAGHVGIPGATLYSATKFGLRGLAYGLRREVARYRIGVSVVSPGFIDTEMTRQIKGVPKAPVDTVAHVIADLLERPRRDVVVPGYYGPPIWIDQRLGRLVDWVLDRWSQWRQRQAR